MPPKTSLRALSLGALLVLSACHADSGPVQVQLSHEDKQELVQGIARAMVPSPKFGATSASPNFNVTDFQNQMVLDFEPNGSVTWVADGGTFSDGGPRTNVAVPTLPGKLWNTFWIDCAGGTSQAAQLIYVDGQGYAGSAGQQHVPIIVPCDTGPLPIAVSAFYQLGLDAGNVTVFPGY